MNITQEFIDITGFKLPIRIANLCSDKVERKDCLFVQLTTLFFSNRSKFIKLKKRVRHWLRKDKTETIIALTGYIYYILEDFETAERFFLKAIYLNPNNLDNWIDFAFTLRHLGDYEVSNGILFNYDYVIYYYKYLKLDDCVYSKIKKLILEINKRVNSLSG